MQKLMIQFLILGSFLIPALSWGMPRYVVLIRHAEKPQDLSRNDLSKKGWARAEALPSLFQKGELSYVGMPSTIFAMAQRKKGSSVRPIQTVSFLASAARISIQSPFVRDDFHDLVDLIKKDRRLNGKTVLICWEGTILSNIASLFGVYPVPEIDSDEFDRAWVLKFNDAGKLEDFDNISQRLLPGDSKR